MRFNSNQLAATFSFLEDPFLNLMLTCVKRESHSQMIVVFYFLLKEVYVSVLLLVSADLEKQSKL